MWRATLHALAGDVPNFRVEIYFIPARPADFARSGCGQDQEFQCQKRYRSLFAQVCDEPGHFRVWHRGKMWLSDFGPAGEDVRQVSLHGRRVLSGTPAARLGVIEDHFEPATKPRSRFG